MQQSEQQALNKFNTRKGDIFWLYHAKLTLVYLYSLWRYLCSLEQLQTFRHKSDAMKNTLNRFHSCLSVIFTIPSAGSKLRTTAFCGLRLKSKMVNSNVPHLRSLVSVSCIEIIVQV